MSEEKDKFVGLPYPYNLRGARSRKEYNKIKEGEDNGG